MRYSRKCSEIMVYSFYAVLETNDFRHLVIGWDEFEEIEIDEAVAKKHWVAIYNENCRLMEDNTTLLYFDLACHLNYLKTRYEVGRRLVEQLEIRRESKIAVELYSAALSECGYPIDPKKDLDKEIAKITKSLTISLNKIRLKEHELEGYAEDEDSEHMTLIQQAVKLEQALGRNEINLRTTSQEKWIMMIKEVKEINEQRTKHLKAS